MTVNIWLVMALTVSIFINAFSFWYIRKILKRLLVVAENIRDLVDMTTAYQSHLRKVYSLELFYGDETIEFLMLHTNSLIDLLEDYKDIYDLLEQLKLKDEKENSE